MRNVTVVAYDPLPGDAMSALPVICELAAEYDNVWLEFQNGGVLDIALFPSNVRLCAEGVPPPGTRNIFLGVSAAYRFGFTPQMLHPTQELMKLAGLTPPDEPLRPRIKPWEGLEVLPVIDVLIAPFTTAPERTLTTEQTIQLGTRLAKHRVALLGGGSNPKPLGMMAYYNYPFAYGAELLRKCKVFVGVDSFPGRLAHAAGVKEHIVLDSGATPIQTQIYPGCRVFPRDMIDAVADKIEELLCG